MYLIFIVHCLLLSRKFLWSSAIHNNPLLSCQMSNIFRLNVISQSQHGAETRKPSPPVAHCSRQLFSYRPNITLVADDNPELFSSFGVKGNMPKPKSTTSGWISRCTPRQLEEFLRMPKSLGNRSRSCPRENQFLLKMQQS